VDLGLKLEIQTQAQGCYLLHGTFPRTRHNNRGWSGLLLLLLEGKNIFLPYLDTRSEHGCVELQVITISEDRKYALFTIQV